MYTLQRQQHVQQMHLSACPKLKVVYKIALKTALGLLLETLSATVQMNGILWMSVKYPVSSRVLSVVSYIVHIMHNFIIFIVLCRPIPLFNSYSTSLHTLSRYVIFLGGLEYKHIQRYTPGLNVNKPLNVFLISKFISEFISDLCICTCIVIMFRGQYI